MVINVATDAFVGSLPLVGDIFDFAYKSNVRNIQIYREAIERRTKGAATDWGIHRFVALVLLRDLPDSADGIDLSGEISGKNVLSRELPQITQMQGRAIRRSSRLKPSASKPAHVVGIDQIRDLSSR